MDMRSTTIAGLFEKEKEKPLGQSCEWRQPQIHNVECILQVRKDTYTCSIYYYFKHWSKTFHFNTKVFQLKHKTIDPLYITAMS